MKKLIILDRDGVINTEIGRHVKHWQDLDLIPDSLLAIKKLYTAGYDIAIATNQSGIEKGLYTAMDLLEIHAYLLQAVRHAGGNINRIIYASSADNQNPLRKPNPGMLTRILAAYPALSASDVFFVGDYARDVKAAFAAACRPVWIQQDPKAALAALALDPSVTLSNAQKESIIFAPSLLAFVNEHLLVNA